MRVCGGGGSLAYNQLSFKDSSEQLENLIDAVSLGWHLSIF